MNTIAYDQIQAFSDTLFGIVRFVYKLGTVVRSVLIHKPRNAFP